jgi:hypothetical protein
MMRHHRYRRRNQVVTLTDDMILIGTGVVIGVIALWIWQKSQEGSSSSPAQTQPIPTGVDSSGNPTYAQQVGPGGVAVFSNQQPSPLPTTGFSNS